MIRRVKIGERGLRRVWRPTRIIKGTGSGMDAVNTWDLALFAIAGYIAVSSLVRLMIGKRNALAVELRDEMEQERRRQQRSEQEKQISNNKPPRPNSRYAADARGLKITSSWNCHTRLGRQPDQLSRRLQSARDDCRNLSELPSSWPSVCISKPSAAR